LTGAIVGGRYRLTDRLAVGGMGEVWRGVDELLGRPVAVKILRTELAHDDAFVRRFREEARTAGSLTHPGIAAVFDYGESAPAKFGAVGDTTSTVSYLVMELVPGEPLSSLLADGLGLGPDRSLMYLAQAARGLHAAHRCGVIHRDVKPANLLVMPDDRVKITDFGIARPQDHEPLTATGQVMGTAHYLAPELARGHQATAQSDIYALGVVLYECLAGHRPFEGDNQVAVATAHLAQEPPPLSTELPREVRDLVSRSMAKDPTRRFTSAEEFALAMEDLARRLDRDAPSWAPEARSAQTPALGSSQPLGSFDAALMGRGQDILNVPRGGGAPNPPGPVAPLPHDFAANANRSGGAGFGADNFGGHPGLTPSGVDPNDPTPPNSYDQGQRRIRRPEPASREVNVPVLIIGGVGTLVVISLVLAAAAMQNRSSTTIPTTVNTPTASVATTTEITQRPSHVTSTTTYPYRTHTVVRRTTTTKTSAGTTSKTPKTSTTAVTITPSTTAVTTTDPAPSDSTTVPTAGAT
jgi:serine/threonine-protein kinase